MRALTASPKGIASLIDRESKAMDELQIYRELVQNGLEAGATQITLDGWADPETDYTLARVTDDGSGMTNRELVEHLSSMLDQHKGPDNYGVGARIAGVARNPAGMTFASRSASDEGMIEIVRHQGLYGLKEWTVEIDGYDQLVEVVVPDEGELDKLGKTKSGTAVIMHGTGKADTWDASVAYKAAKFLAERYYQFPGEATVKVSHGLPTGMRTVKPFGVFLAEQATADGEIPFKDVGGLDGVIFWWVLPKYEEVKNKLAGLGRHSGGVGVVVEDEIFDYSTSISSDFGLIYNSVAKRVAMLVWIDDASMDTGRAGFVLPGRKTVPWKKLGQHFAAHMPEAINDLLTQVTVNSSAFDAELAKLLDEDWMKKLDPINVAAKAKQGEPLIGEDPGPEAGTVEIERKGKKKRKSTAAKRTSGSDPGKVKPKVVTPMVQFLPQEEVNEQKLITYLQTANTLQIAYEFPPYVREIGRWVEQTGHPEAIVKMAVESAYRAEFAATIIDANGQSKHGMSQELIEKLKSDEALYTKALGFQSLSERVGAFIKDAVRGA